MARMIDQIRASKLPSNMMQFAARGALQVPPAENIEILVYLARYNKVFGEVARMTLAGWDEKASLAAAADPKTPQEVLNYFISPDNVRPKLLPALLENPSVREAQIVKLAGSALRDTIDIMLKSPRVRSLPAVLENLKSSPYLKQEEVAELRQLLEAKAAAAEQVQGAPAGDVTADSVHGPMPSRAGLHHGCRQRRHVRQAGARETRARHHVAPTPVASFRQFAQRVAVAIGDVFGHGHLVSEIILVRRHAEAAIRRFREHKGIALACVEASQRFLRQHDAHRVADLADFQFEYHEDSVATNVITSRGIGRVLRLPRRPLR